MAAKEINLGRVKGDPLTWNDLTDEQKESLRGQKGDTAPPPIIKIGEITTVESYIEAGVESHTDGNTTTFDFQIPKGQKGNDYSAGMLNTIAEVMSSTDSTKFPGILAIHEMMEEITADEIANIFNN